MQSDDFQKMSHLKKSPTGREEEDNSKFNIATVVDLDPHESTERSFNSNSLLFPLRKYKKLTLDKLGGISIEDSAQLEIKQTKKANFNLFKNPKSQKNLILKRTNKNIRLGYKKILKKDSSYDELYQEKNATEEFLCCKEYKRYVDDLVLSHQEEPCIYAHKGGLDYLREVACNEILQGNLKDKNEDCGKIVKCPLNFCKDTFCYQCDLCRSQDLEDFSNNKKSK